MTIHHGKVRISFLIRHSVRYLLVSRGFYLVEAIIVLATLSFMLTGSRIAAIDHYGNRADIVATFVVTFAVTALLTLLNRRVRTAIDRHFFGEEYNAKQILTELGEAIPTLLETKQVLEFIAGKIDDALHPQNVTIFLDDEDRGAYVAAYSADASNAGTTVPCSDHTVLLHYEGQLVSRLRESKQLISIELTETDLLSLSAGLRSGTVLSDHESLTLRAVRSSVLIPIVSHHHLDGLISLGQRLSGLPYVKEDKLLLLIVANQIAAFIENRKLINRIAREERAAREVQMAAEVQRHLFPIDGFEDDELELYGTCLPALGIAGDYYDYFEMDKSSTGIAIADVAGKGIPAALLMSTVQASLRCQLITKGRSLSDVVASMNKLLRHSTSDGGYASFFLAQFDRETRGLTYVNAGHNPPILIRRRSPWQRDRFGPGSREVWLNKTVRAGGQLGLVVAEEPEEPEVRLLTTGGPIIGTFLNEAYEQETILLGSGDVLVVYTDGVTEARNPAGAEFGEEKLRAIIFESLLLTPREMAAKVIAKVLEWQGQAAQHDDVTLMVMRIK